MSDVPEPTASGTVRRRSGLPRSAAAAAAAATANRESPAAAPATPAPAQSSPDPARPALASPAGRRSGLSRPGSAASPTEAVAATTSTVTAPRPERAPVAPPASTSAAAQASAGPWSRRLPVVAWSVGGALALLAVTVLAARWFLFDTQAGRDFLVTYPGATRLPGWTPRGLPAWVEWQHFLNSFFMVLVIRTGWMLRTSTRPSASWSRRGGGRRIAIELWAHLSLDLLWIVNGAVFLVLLFSTGQWARIVPSSWGVIPNAVSAGLQYLSLNWPTEDGWANYNSLQLLTYFATVFVAAPLAALTGIRMSPLWPAKAERLSRAYPMQLARALHFPVMLYFVAFVIVHVGLVLSTGALRNLNHMYGHQDAVNWWGFGVFLASVAVIVGGALLVRPILMQQAGALFGKVGR